MPMSCRGLYVNDAMYGSRQKMLRINFHHQRIMDPPGQMNEKGDISQAFVKTWIFLFSAVRYQSYQHLVQPYLSLFPIISIFMNE